MRHAPLRVLLLALASSLATVAASAQTGRTMRLTAPVVTGETAAFAIRHPSALAGNVYSLLASAAPFAGAVPVNLPGLNVNGLLRLDLATMVIVDAGVLNASGQSPELQFAIPNSASLVGLGFEIQGVDMDPLGSLSLTDDDLELVVAAPPLPGANLVAIPAGTFAMGNDGLVYDLYYEGPVHQVTISRPFWIGRYEVTQLEYAALVGSNPSSTVGTSLPVTNVNWFEAVTYCDLLTAQEAAAGRLPSGYEYRLPTEAEWEYCCRAGSSTLYSFGNTIACVQANHMLACQGQTTPVGSYAPNAFGLHDMHGNVFEWVLDAWDGGQGYGLSPVSDPVSTAGSLRPLRGGSFDANMIFARSAARASFFPISRSGNVGFRVVLAPTLP